MDSETRKLVLDSFGAASQQLQAVLDATDPAKWHMTPAPNEWSIRQIIFHIADSEANYYLRLRKAIAEPGGVVVAYDQNLWDNSLAYEDRSTDEALALFRLLRASSYRLLAQLPEKTWSNPVQHSERGRLTLEDLLLGSVSHIAEHIQQIESNTKSSSR
ncbi:DinB family protein [Dehalogenimonas sp. THU2]|uniref:DinB family protein n=1 Tax=Dehalogenimonas sp. THU2 TaxID=3151121 RepID=UPI0032187367